MSFSKCFDQRMAGQAMLVIASWLKELTAKARRQPVKVVKLAGSLACVVAQKKTTKLYNIRLFKTLVHSHPFSCANAKHTSNIFYQKTLAPSYKIHLRPSWPAMILVSAPAKRRLVNVQTDPLPLSTEHGAKKYRRDFGVARSNARFPIAFGMYNPQSRYAEMQIWLMLLL